MAKKVKEKQEVKRNVEETLEKGKLSLVDMIMPDAYQETKDYIYLGPNKYARMHAISVYPHNVYVGILNEFFAELGNIDISTYIENIPNSQIIRTLTNKMTALQSNLILEEKNVSASNYGLRKAIADLDNLRESIQTNTDRMFVVQVIITIWGDSEQELKEKCSVFEDICSRKALKPRVLTFDQGGAFISSLPYKNIKHDDSIRNMTSGAIASFVPTGNTEMSHKSGIYLGNNVFTNSPIFFDNFIGPPEVTNPMMGIFGMAGAGKSVTMKLVASRGAASGEWVIILDPEQEYKDIVDHLGGQYIEIKAGSNIGINPFELEVESDGQLDIYAKISEIREMISLFCEKYRQMPLKGEEITSVEEIMKEMYTKRGITKDGDSLYEAKSEEVDGKFFMGKVKKEMPTLSELREELAKNPYTQDLAQTIKIITGDGSLAMFDGQTKVDLNKRIIGISFKHIGDDFMKFYAMVNILSWIWGKFSNWKYKDIKKRVIVDEGWLFAKYERSAAFLEEIARRGRKYKISLVIASQMINEFLGSDSGKAVIHQCATKLIMKQDPSVAKVVADFFDLSDKSADFLGSFTAGTGMLLTEQDQVVLKMNAFNFEWGYIKT
ncbi:MAG: DUF87 domain-containing protein [Clostridia bacterium]|jgi:type IV secretory pathway VirB4 component|nr:DUF87 domain-containing protein [Clostridia bacterium]